MTSGPPEISAGDTPEYWERHWDQYAEATRLNPAQGYRRRLIFRLLGDRAREQDATILDVGCGSGDQLEAIGTEFPDATLAGIDQSKTGLEVTARNFPDALLYPADFENPETTPDALKGWASHAVCSEVLEHIEEPVTALKNLLAYLKPGARLIITVPGGPKSAFDRAIGHHRHYTARRLRHDLEQAGYEVEVAASAGFPMFNLYRLVVCMRGDQLTEDIGGTPSFIARTAMAVFRLLLHFTLFKTPWGWQIVAAAKKPE